MHISSLFSTHVTSTPYGVRSVHVSALRFIVVTRLTEGSVFVGNCEADGGSAEGVRDYGALDRTTRAGRCMGLPLVSWT